MAEPLTSAVLHRGTVFRRLVSARVRSQLQYRASFWTNLCGSAGASLLDLAAIVVLFSHIEALGGWSIAEVCVLYGMSGLSFGLTDLVMGHLDRLGLMIRMGELDVVLVRPLGSLMQVLSADFQLRRIGKLIQAIVVLLWALAAAGFQPTPAKLCVLLVSLASAAVLFGAIWVTFAAICFWTADASEITNSFTYGGNFLAQYPITIFGPWVRRLLAFVIPAAFVAYFPALYLLDRPRPGWLAVAPFATPLVALAAACAAGAVWRFAVHHYRSTGS